MREAVLFCVGSGLALSASLCSAALPLGELDSLSQNLTVLPAPLFVTCGDIFPRPGEVVLGEGAFGMAAKFQAEAQSLPSR